MTDATDTIRARVVAGYKTHGTVRNTSAALSIPRDTVSRILRDAGALRPQGGTRSKTLMTCPKCGNRRRINPIYENKPLCRTCRAIDTQEQTLEDDPPRIEWVRRGLVLVAAEVYDPLPDTKHRGESAA